MCPTGSVVVLSLLRRVCFAALTNTTEMFLKTAQASKANIIMRIIMLLTQCTYHCRKQDIHYYTIIRKSMNCEDDRTQNSELRILFNII